ncbi:DUF6331 family protein [Aquimarina sp. MMG016]|uniref:DUF6331 family protein n=1 Tax=Aquimarina sp. MMG016 TaxID=2822690 RepID=UPI001B39DAB2|nr:DUF6331 family protein [Aquimarina sp. MMG016]MBQ4820737.1 hypothetical protein [Aquimarina sp. MMG016]
MKLKGSFSADIYLELNKEFWRDLEIHCVAECCGVDAFDFSKEEIQKTITCYDKEEIINNLDFLLGKIELSDYKYVSSGLFDEYSKKKVFVERIKRIKENILK